MYIIIGCISYILLFIFDFNKIKQIHPLLNATFGLGVIMLIGAGIGVLTTSPVNFWLPNYFRIIFAILAIISFVLQIYTLFFAIPFDKTYLDLNIGNKVVDTGMFALSRHPGVIWFFFLSIFLWLASGKMMMIWAGIIWTAFDVLHVYIQDRWQFPLMFSDYNVYIRKVPFLIPTLQSIKNSLKRRK